MARCPTLVRYAQQSGRPPTALGYGFTSKVPDGQITSDFPKLCQARFAKIFLFSLDPNQFTDSPRPVSTRGALRNVINAGRDAVDAAARETNAVCFVRRSRVVLTPRSWRQVCEKTRR